MKLPDGVVLEIAVPDLVHPVEFPKVRYGGSVLSRETCVPELAVMRARDEVALKPVGNGATVVLVVALGLTPVPVNVQVIVFVTAGKGAVVLFPWLGIRVEAPVPRELLRDHGEVELRLVGNGATLLLNDAVVLTNVPEVPDLVALLEVGYGAVLLSRPGGVLEITGDREKLETPVDSGILESPVDSSRLERLALYEAVITQVEVEFSAVGNGGIAEPMLEVERNSVLDSVVTPITVPLTLEVAADNEAAPVADPGLDCVVFRDDPKLTEAIEDEILVPTPETVDNLVGGGGCGEVELP
ncbi:hypothetical protein S7711_10375 [Stachybotrys chartarum IBT 7711]|jgi:hypothetical protein|uniref:Uncharacterized protein n=1 Tax=Stachybotrys chartarum (strain CBS 109288 / IBT 7711) TaxID=1280523 RepID=A0A084ATT8_STACB|nr:hypothetical protein S7711_10375 [Stachybotrys chartarum IBT 7711]KFA48679.1 hypothetical protein S40293_10829 [Stachybotrys chartarum IBT 40293]